MRVADRMAFSIHLIIIMLRNFEFIALEPIGI